MHIILSTSDTWIFLQVLPNAMAIFCLQYSKDHTSILQHQDSTKTAEDQS